MDSVYPISQALAIVQQVMLGALGFLVDSVGELYALMMAVVGFAILLTLLVRPSTFGATWLSIPLEAGIFFFFIGFMLDNWQYLIELWLDIMVDTGLAAGGNQASIDFRDVGAIAWRGWEVSLPIMDAIKQLSMWSIYSIPIMFIMMIAVVVIWVVYVGIALTVLLMFIAFYVLSVMAFFLLPFALWSRTAFLGDGGLKYVAITGATIMAVALVFATMDRLVNSLTWSSSATLSEIFVNLCAVALMGMAIFKVVKMMQRLVGAAAGTHIGLGSFAGASIGAAFSSFGTMAAASFAAMTGRGGGGGSGGGSGGGGSGGGGSWGSGGGGSFTPNGGANSGIKVGSKVRRR